MAKIALAQKNLNKKEQTKKFLNLIILQNLSKAPHHWIVPEQQYQRFQA